MLLFEKFTCYLAFLLLLTCALSSVILAESSSPHWLQGGHDEFQSNLVMIQQPTPSLNISVNGPGPIYFERELIVVDARKNIMIVNYQLYDGEKFPQFNNFVLGQVDLNTGKLTELIDTTRPVFSNLPFTRAVLSPEGVYYFALSNGNENFNFIFTHNLTDGESNYYHIENSTQVNGLAFVDQTLYVLDVAALIAYTPAMVSMFSIPYTFAAMSNLISTQENGRNVLYYGGNNIIYRFDTSNRSVKQLQIPSKNLYPKSISYLGNGMVLVVFIEGETNQDSIYIVNVSNGMYKKLQINDSNLGKLKECSNSMNIQANPKLTYSVLNCGKVRGLDKNVIGIQTDATNQQNPKFEIIWHLPMHSESLHVSATRNNQHFLLSNDHGYMVMEIDSGKMVSAKKSTIANSSCKVITAMNGKFYSVCTDTVNLRITSENLN